jgi:nicotinamidase-related amidase
MAVTTLDRKTALIVIDLQNGIVAATMAHPTARQAHEHGYNVTLAVDAMADRDPDTHTNSVTRIFPKLGETGTTAEIIALLAAS